MLRLNTFILALMVEVDVVRIIDICCKVHWMLLRYAIAVCQLYMIEMRRENIGFAFVAQIDD